MEIMRYLRVLKRRLGIIVLTTFVTATVLWFSARGLDPSFTAVATVRVAQASAGAIDYSSYMYADRLMNTYKEIVTSRPILEKVVERLGSDIHPDTLAEQITVSVVRDTELLTLAVEDRDSGTAANIANTVAAILSEQPPSLYLGGSKTERQVLEEQLQLVERSLQDDRARLQAAVNDATVNTDVVDTLNTRIRSQEDSYMALLHEYENARVSEAWQSGSVTVVEPAVAPQTPSGRGKGTLVLMGAMVGLLGGTGLAFVFENLDPTLHSLDDLERITETRVLAAIPSLHVPSRLAQHIMVFDRDGPASASETYSLLGASVLSRVMSKTPRTLLVTSAEPGAGKSTVLVNLALALAQTGKRVVAVDSDLRDPSLHRVFEVSNDVGFSQAVARPQVASDILQRTEISNLRVMPSGNITAHPSEILITPNLQLLIERISSDADIVLFDSPPILTVADAAILAPLVDGVLVVTARNQTTGEQVQRVLRQMNTLGATTLGIVFNRARV